MASGNVIEFTDDNFEQEVLQADKPVLVDFWADWCQPCRMIAPIVEELADEYAGKAKIGKMDTDSNRQTAMNFGISAIPTLLLFKDGELARKVVGAKSKKDLKAELDALLG